MFKELTDLNSKPENFERSTTSELWTDAHRASQMLKYHLNKEVDISSRNHLFIQKSVQWIYDYFNIDSNSRIADFGCGPGLYTTPLASMGAQVTGIDFSSSSLNYARKQAQKAGLKIQYKLGNYLEINLEESYDLVYMIFCDFCALTPKQRGQLLQKFHSILKPGGKVLLDVSSEKAFEQKSESTNYSWLHNGGFWSSQPYHEFKASFKYPATLSYLDKYLIVEENKSYWIYNWLHHYNQSSLCKTFEKAGFTPNELFSDVAGTPLKNNQDELAIVAEKK